VAVLGVGLIGASVALAARERAGARVSGWDPDPRALETALGRGALDVAAASPGEAVEEAEVVVVAAPVGALAEAVGAALDAAGEDVVVTDVGSTKRAVVAAHDDPRFVGGHPLAGAESAGAANARADLFDGATWYLTPTPRTTGTGLERLYRLVRALGARPQAIDPETHDAVLAGVSHLPHVLANVLVSQVAGALEEQGERLPATGPSFRDATRVAGASSAIWTDIYLSNRDALVAQLDAVVERLGSVRASLAAGDRDAVEAWNEAAAADRRGLLETDLAGGPLHELRVSVPDRPGIVAEVALALGRAGVNITDMALYPAPDGSEGHVALWIAGEGPARRAEGVLEGDGLRVTRA